MIGAGGYLGSQIAQRACACDLAVTSWSSSSEDESLWLQRIRGGEFTSIINAAATTYRSPEEAFLPQYWKSNVDLPVRVAQAALAAVIPCTPNHPVGNLLISFLNTGYMQIPGFAGGEPNSLRDVPAETLKILAESRALVGVITDGPPANSSDLKAHGFRIRCRHTKTLVLEKPVLTLCLGTVQPEKSREDRG